RGDVWTVDVGGTTTDIAALRDGWPALNVDGARVAGWRTMIEAVDVHTTGLGGDSLVRIDREGELRIGPQRAIPLCLLASEYPAVLAALREVTATAPARWDDGLLEFLTLGRRPKGALHPAEQELLDRVAREPAQDVALVERTAFTPTDALHALGRFDRWNAEAARLAANALARRAGMSAEAFCELVVARFSERVATEVINKVLEDEVGRPDWEREQIGQALLRRALESAPDQDLGCALTLRRPLVAIGAPVGAYLPRAAGILHTELVIPEHSDVANAVGAVSGSIIQRATVIVNPIGGEGHVRAHGLPQGPADFGEVEAAVRHSEQTMAEHLTALAQEAGAEHVELSWEREDLRVPLDGALGQDLFLGSTLRFTAAGRPRVARLMES
ncbi:MAG: hypothetical protein MUC34_15725, partial [Anaerolineae bacterium]|nr:hypothetical protein [Anaerolineae bacterium]